MKQLERFVRWTLQRRGFQSIESQTSVGTMHSYQSQGHGPLSPIVFVHGLAASAMNYGQLMVPMRNYAKAVIAPDLPGHGWSDVPTEEFHAEVIYQGLQEFLDHTLDEPFYLVGNSLGGGLSIRYALDRPERVKGLILLSPAGAPMSEEEYKILRKLFDVRDRKSARRFIQHLYGKTPWYARLLEGIILSLLRRKHIQELFNTFVPQEEIFSQEKLGQMSMPILFLWGAEEKLLPLSGFEYYRQHLPPHTQFERPPKHGHTPQGEFPKQILRRILDFTKAPSSPAQTTSEKELRES